MAVQLGAERAPQPANRQSRHFTSSNATNSWSVPFHRWYRAMRQATHGERGRRDPASCRVGSERSLADTPTEIGQNRRNRLVRLAEREERHNG